MAFSKKKEQQIIAEYDQLCKIIDPLKGNVSSSVVSSMILLKIQKKKQNKRCKYTCQFNRNIY